ncbi:MAG TPA: O-antigen polysaccharide polymerase Wzy [Vicinamibacterales bacterium]|jgi:hypothetical protein
MRWFSAHTQRLLTGSYACLAGALAIGVALLLPGSGLDATAHFVWIGLVSIATAGLLAVIAGVSSATAVYMAVFWCFHFGLVISLAIGVATPADLSPWDETWILSPFSSEAAGLALAGALAFASGACLMLWLRSRTAPNARSGAAHSLVHDHGFAGSLLVFVTTATWAGIVVTSSGLGALFSSYEDYLQATAEYGSVFAVLWPVLGCGLVMSVTGRKAWYRTVALVTFGCFALVALPLGLRSEVMFPAVGVFIALARVGKGMTSPKALAVAVVILLIIPVVRAVRESGLRAFSTESLSLPGIGALMEMGGSLHPVEKVVRWHAEGEPYERGASYWAPFERGAARLLPGARTARAADDDLRLMNVLVLDRIGAIGFSPVAEAYRNFGPIGVVIIMGLLGVVIGTIDTVADPRTAVLLIATVYVPLLVNVRNSFVSVPAQCALGVLLATLIAAVRHVVGSVLSKPHARLVDHRSPV